MSYLAAVHHPGQSYLSLLTSHNRQISATDTYNVVAVCQLQTPETKRHLLRFWVHTDSNPRPVAGHYAPRSNVNPEGGFRVPEGSKLRLPLFPYSRHDGQGQS